MRRLLQDLDSLAPKPRGDAFEFQVVPWILRQSAVYRDDLVQVWAWKHYHERYRWGPDIGIDLIAQERTGRLWAIQAKAHAPDHDVTWADISTFVGAAAAQPEIACLVLMTTAQSVGQRARHQLQRCGKQAIIIDRERLRDLGLPDDVGLADLTKPTITVPRLTPRPHQSEAIAATVEGFRSSARGQVIHACGTGKTLTALWTKEALGSQRAIVFCPSLGLVDQTLRAWQAQRSSPYTAIVVCSDQTIGGPDSEGEGAASLDLAVPPTTDAARLRQTLEENAGAVVVFATYQSSVVIAEALRGNPFRFDLLVADEAHRTTGLSGTDFHRPLDDAQIGADRRLFLTATPRIYKARRVPDADDDAVEVISMDDATQYGPVFHRLSFRAAIELDLLSDYRVVIIGVTPGEVADQIAQRAYVTHDDQDVAEASELATHVALARTMREFGMRRTISFHSRVKLAKVFADRFLRVTKWLPQTKRPTGSVWTETLSGEDPVHRRRKVLRRLQEGTGGESGLVTNARCLSEGVDVPALDGIVFVDPKSSETDIVQAVGRALRKSDDKSGDSTIVLPLVIPDDAGEATSELEGSAYAYTWRVVEALRAHDEVLGEELDALRRDVALKRGQAGARLPSKIILRVPTRVSTAFAQALTLRILERTTSSWETGYAHLEAYHARKDDCRVPALHKEDGFRLGQWVSHQRKAATAGTLSPERRAKLDTLGFVWDPLAEQWETGYAHLEAYHARKSDCLVPGLHKEDGYRLGQWVGKQRTAASKGTLSPERRAKLDTLGFVWDLLAEQWETG
ncbi:MAG: helicase, partial [Gemmatimonadetes bacterium]|nr:helicase [Gemmatimonadota bacterium]